MIYRFCHIHSRTPGVLFAFLPGLFLSSFTSSTFSLSLSFSPCMRVCMCCKFNYFPLLSILSFSRCFLCNSFISLRDPSVPLDRIQGFFPSLFLSLHCTPFRSVTLFLPKLFHILFSSFFIPFSFLFILHRCLPFAASFLVDSSFSFRLITQYALSFFSLCHSLFLLFLPRSCTLFLFSYLFFLTFFYVDPSSSYALFSLFINILLFSFLLTVSFLLLFFINLSFSYRHFTFSLFLFVLLFIFFFLNIFFLSFSTFSSLSLSFSLFPALFASLYFVSSTIYLQLQARGLSSILFHVRAFPQNFLHQRNVHRELFSLHLTVGELSFSRSEIGRAHV